MKLIHSRSQLLCLCEPPIYTFLKFVIIFCLQIGSAHLCVWFLFFFFNFSSACFFSFLYNRDSIDSLLLAIRGGVVWLGEIIHQLQSNISRNKCLQTTLSFDLHHIIVYTIQAFYLTVLPLFLYSLHCRPVSLTPCRQLHPPIHLSLSLISSNCALGAAMQY